MGTQTLKPKKRVYVAKPGARFPRNRAQEIGEYLETFGDQITATVVVEDAKRKDSPLHNLFNWDDSDAAHRWRLQQAMNLLNHIDIRLVVEGNEVNESAFVNLTNSKIEVSDDEEAPNGYYSLHKTLTDRRLYAAHKANLRRKLEALKREYRQWADVISRCISEIKRKDRDEEVEEETKGDYGRAGFAFEKGSI